MPKPQQKRTPAKPKPPVKRAPNLPEHNLPEPYTRLTTLGDGEFPLIYESIAEKLSAGDKAQEVETLIGIVTDGKWYSYIDFDTFPPDKDPFAVEPRLNVPLHALCTLALMGEAADNEAERLLPLFHSDDEALAEETGYVFASMGEPILPMLNAHLRSRESDPNIRAGIAESLKLMTETYPHLQDRCVGLLTDALANEEHPEVSVYLITALMDIGESAAYSLIAEAFQEGRVDDTLLSLAEVQGFFDIPVAPSPELSLSASPPENVELSADDAPPEEIRLPFVAEGKAGRNDPCPCGSGKKYKKCCGA